MQARPNRLLPWLSCLCLAACAWLGSMPRAHAQVSTADARQLGLEVAWQAQLQLPKFGRGIASADLWVDSSAAATRKYATVELGSGELGGGRTIEISADTLDAKGEPIGIEAAKQLAAERAARLLGRNDGFQVIETNVPTIRLVVATSDGLVQTLDAETGRLLWSSSCGSSSAPAHPAALSPAGVSLIHGRHLYLLDWQTGKQLQRKELEYGSSIALAVAGNLAYVSDFRGRIEAYGLGTTVIPWTAQISGRSVGQPVSLKDQSFCAIASSNGYMYTMRGGDTPGMWTRYAAASAMSGCLAAGNHAFYVGSVEGVLAKIGVDPKLENMVWDVTTGEPLTSPPLVIGERIYVANESGRLLCIDDNQGALLWTEAGMRILQPLAVASGKLFCTTLAERLAAVDAQTGRLLASTQPLSLATSVVNQTSDRVYLVDTAGRVQCLRSFQAKLPKLVEPVVAGEAEEAEQSEAGASQTAPPAASQDPFGTGEAAAGANPFGGAAAGANPFGGAAAGANPFGGASDPFGAPAPATPATDEPATGEPATDPFGVGGADPFGS